MPIRLWITRILIAVVFFINVQCALVFILSPQVYASNFELAGAAGEGILRGMGILFLMWNVPYAVALWQPFRHRLSLVEAVVMQSIGVGGESLLLLNLEAGHALLRQSIGRFILFDALGLGLLLLAALITFNNIKITQP